MLSKILLIALSCLLVSRFGLLKRLLRYKPQLDRAVNVTIALLVVVYFGQALWWILQSRSPH